MKHWIGISEFVAVAEQQSFTKAARSLGISVAQVSRNIAELETSLAIKLLYRSTRNVSLTEEGAAHVNAGNDLPPVQVTAEDDQGGETLAEGAGLHDAVDQRRPQDVGGAFGLSGLGLRWHSSLLPHGLPPSKTAQGSLLGPFG